MVYKILIIDDDDTIRESYALKFRQEKFEVISAKDGVEGLDLAHKEKPDIIFTGIIMPRMTGFELMGALSKEVSTSEIPVVISSHLGRKEDDQRAKELGAKDFIIHGEVTLNQIVTRIRNILGERFVYKISVNKDKYNAKDLAELLEKNSSFTCPNCGKEILLVLDYLPKEKIFRVSMKCSSCQK